jgi:N-acetylglucosamine kinase-like BadF-type ATPase
MHNLVANIVGGEIEIVGDVEIAFGDAFGTGPGVLAIAGTGSIVYGKNAAGETARAGGWGHEISDEGSGYWIGVEAVRAALHAHDRAESQELLTALSNALGARNFEDFIIQLNASPAPDFASLFPAVLGAARDSGDATAKQVLEHAGHELAKLAESVIHRLSGNDKVSVVTYGGVMTNGEEVRDSFVKHLESLCPQAGFTQKLVDPARGALERARTR